MELRAIPAADSQLILGRVLDELRAAPGAVAVFDLDSTLFDNRPRQARILREFGAANAVPELGSATAAHFSGGWDLGLAMLAAGLPRARVAQLHDSAKDFWRERFFTSDYCLEDVPIDGAPAFVRHVRDVGGVVAYCTGRHEVMRAGSTESLRRAGFPVPGEERVKLLMKAELAEGDDDYKRRAHRELAALGRIVAAFDNEPIHINDYHRVFPEAFAIHLATDHSGRPVAVAQGIPAIPNFQR